MITFLYISWHFYQVKEKFIQFLNLLLVLFNGTMLEHSAEIKQKQYKEALWAIYKETFDYKSKQRQKEKCLINQRN